MDIAIQKEKILDTLLVMMMKVTPIGNMLHSFKNVKKDVMKILIAWLSLGSTMLALEVILTTVISRPVHQVTMLLKKIWKLNAMSNGDSET